MDGFDDIDMGYTPARGVARSLSELFHDPQDSRPATKKAATKAEYHRDNPYFQKLGEMTEACSESRVGGCENCTAKKRCNWWWTGIANQTGVRHQIITAEMYEQYKREFEERIKPR